MSDPLDLFTAAKVRERTLIVRCGSIKWGAFWEGHRARCMARTLCPYPKSAHSRKYWFHGYGEIGHE